MCRSLRRRRRPLSPVGTESVGCFELFFVESVRKGFTFRSSSTNGYRDGNEFVGRFMSHSHGFWVI